MRTLLRSLRLQDRLTGLAEPCYRGATTISSGMRSRHDARQVPAAVSERSRSRGWRRLRLRPQLRMAEEPSNDRRKRGGTSRDSEGSAFRLCRYSPSRAPGQRTTYEDQLDGTLRRQVTCRWRGRSSRDECRRLKRLATGRVGCTSGTTFAIMRYLDDFPFAPINERLDDTATGSSG